MHVYKKTIEQKKLLEVGLKLTDLIHISSENSCCATTYTTTQNHYNVSINGHKKLKKLDNVKIGNLKKKNRDHKNCLNKMKMLVTYKFYYI